MKLSPPTRPSEAFPAAASPGPASPTGAARPARLRPRMPRLGMGGWFALLVLLPTLLVGAYYATWAADLYEAEARFLVRGRQAPAPTPAAAVAGMMGGGALGALRSGAEESRAVAEFVDSRQSIVTLGREMDLPAVWRRAEADLLSRLWWRDPPAEWMLWYWRRRVTLAYDPETGISTLRVLAFRPTDARDVAEGLLRHSEALVNRFSARTQEDTLRVAREEVARAERRLVEAREAMSTFREREQALDPARAATGAAEVIARLEGALAQARAELQERQAFMRPDNPQIQVLRNRIAALQAQVATERGRITRGEEAIVQQVAGFERLTLEREFAEKQLASAIQSLETARADALRQQVFLMRVVEPHVPQAALYPKATFNTLTVFASLSVLFGIGWLLVAGAREHAS